MITNIKELNAKNIGNIVAAIEKWLPKNEDYIGLTNRIVTSVYFMPADAYTENRDVEYPNGFHAYKVIYVGGNTVRIEIWKAYNCQDPNEFESVEYLKIA